MFKHTATHDGHEFTRTTVGRKYTHCIVRMFSIAKERSQVEVSARRYVGINIHYMTFLAAQQPGVVTTYEAKGSRPWTRAWDAEEIQKAQEWLAKGLDGLITEWLADFDKQTARRKLNKAGTHFYSGGDEWCGRPDLADKAVAKWMNHGFAAYAVPAVVVEHAPKPRKAK
jgi:hypothetical protein